MDLTRAIEISASGLTAQRTRVNIHSSNLANVNSTRAEGNGPYQRKLPIFEEQSFESALDDQLSDHLSKVAVADVVPAGGPPRLVYDPAHPDSNEDGYVAMPDVNPITELVDLMQASRAYEANVSAIRSAKEMIQAALSIGRP